MYDYVIVGAGLAGGVLARKLAEEKRKKVLIIERRSHLAGNMYDYCDEHHIRIQKYGPHVFHTDDEEAYKFIKRFCTPIPYKTKCEAVINDINTPSPFNFKTIDQFYPKEEAANLKKALLEEYQGRFSVPVMEMMESSNQDIRSFANFLFENDYRPYTAKQWNLSPDEIDPSVLKRVPIVLSYSDTYFHDKYEFMPKAGFEVLYQNLIEYPGIDVQLGVNALDHIQIDRESKKISYNQNDEMHIIYTGALDEFFQYQYGVLPYRSLYFDFQSMPIESFQDTAIVAYPQAIGYTRITEYTKMPVQHVIDWTTVAYEYPVKYDKKSKKGNEPYYPVLTEQSEQMYKKYLSIASEFENLTLCGRLADFKYYNMDQVIIRALEVYNTL